MWLSSVRALHDGTVLSALLKMPFFLTVLVKGSGVLKCVLNLSYWTFPLNN